MPTLVTKGEEGGTNVKEKNEISGLEIKVREIYKNIGQIYTCNYTYIIYFIYNIYYVYT